MRSLGRDACGWMLLPFGEELEQPAFTQSLL
jgi:hypothetical protein